MTEAFHNRSVALQDLSSIAGWRVTEAMAECVGAGHCHRLRDSLWEASSDVWCATAEQRMPAQPGRTNLPEWLQSQIMSALEPAIHWHAIDPLSVPFVWKALKTLEERVAQHTIRMRRILSAKNGRRRYFRTDAPIKSGSTLWPVSVRHYSATKGAMVQWPIRRCFNSQALRKTRRNPNMDSSKKIRTPASPQAILPTPLNRPFLAKYPCIRMRSGNAP